MAPVNANMECTTPTEKPLVAFLGPPASYTHQVRPPLYYPGSGEVGREGEIFNQKKKKKSDACPCADHPLHLHTKKATKSAFPERDHVYTPVATIKDVFDTVAAGRATYGVVPFENSTHGVVTFTLGCLADRGDAYGSLDVCGDVYIDVHHYLLGYKKQGSEAEVNAAQLQQQQQQQQQATPTPTTGSAPTPAANPKRVAAPEQPLDHIRRVYSHPQAFGQTQAFASAHLGHAEAVDVNSTSRAAELASLDRTGATAAVAGVSAAGAFGLDVLARCIEDRDDNTTRFFVLRRRGAGGGGGGGGEEEKKKGGVGAKGTAVEGRRTGHHKSLVSFTVPHEAPGALASVLDVFRTYGLNLTSINSLPSLVRPFQGLFFVEFDGSRHHDPDGRVAGALGEVDRVAESWRWLGSWESQR